MSLQPRSLQQRIFFYTLLPTFVLLLVLSITGFIFLRGILIEYWGAAALSRLQGAVHIIDSELRKPKELLLMLKQSSDSDSVSSEVLNHILTRISELEVVSDVRVILPEDGGDSFEPSTVGIAQMMLNVDRYRIEHFEITSPEYNSRLRNRTVSLISKFVDHEGKPLGQVEVVVAFDPLIDQLVKEPWWRSYKTYLLNAESNVLFSSGNGLGLEDAFPMRSFGTMSLLERETVAAIEENSFGLVFGHGFPPEEVGGYYKLSEAPWTMVVIAPGHEVLSNIINFRYHYVLVFALATILILFFIRRSTSLLTTRIKNISKAAEDLAKGVFGPPLRVNGKDEVEELTRNFNRMSKQLHQRLLMKEALHIAREIQQNLLPGEDFAGDGILVSGKSLYCDETGGDYFDILKSRDSDNKVAVVVGDVVGHGVGAALLMTSVRALLRSRVSQPGSPSEIITDVNKVLYDDTSRSGNFVTLFYLDLDREADLVRWVRGGHDPALVYYPADGKIVEMKGEGIALGIDGDWTYREYVLPLADDNPLILITSDGAWEVENEHNEIFGKERVKESLIRASSLEPNEIIEKILDEIDSFRGDFPQNDDITLAVIKT